MASDYVDPGTAPTSRLSIQRRSSHVSPGKSFSRVTQQFWILSCDESSRHLVSPGTHTVPMIEIRPLYPRTWEPSEPLVAYNNADTTVVAAAEMTRGNNSYYDRYGYQGSQDIVCADCKQDGRDLPVILVDAKRKRLHFRHKQGEAPDCLGRQGGDC